MLDHELNDRFVGMDRRFDRLERLIVDRLDGVDQRLDGIDQRVDAIDQRLAGVDRQFEGVGQRLDGIDERLDGIDQRVADTRTHMDVIAEGLRDDIRLVAEGYDALRSDVTDLKAGQARLEAKFDRLELRQRALERRSP